MKKNIVVLSVFLCSIGSPILSNNPIPWIRSFKQAQKLSRETNKPILLDFWAPWCGPCKRMDREVWNKEEIQELMENYIPVKLNFDRASEMKKKYNIRVIPYVYIVDGWGNRLHAVRGYKSEAYMSKTLNSFSPKLTSLHENLKALETDKKSVSHNLGVGLEYQSKAFYVNGYSKTALIRKSDEFLTLARKYCKRKEVLLIEKIELSQLLNEAYSGAYSSVLDRIDKDFKEIDASNKALLSYIQFYCYHNLGDQEKSDLFYGNLNSEDQIKASLIRP